MLIPITILTAGLVSISLTEILKNYALKKGLTDKPNDRSSHTIPTPRIGGIAILVSWYLGLTVFFLSGKIENKLYYALLCGLPIALISLVDDLKSINPLLRLSVHFLSSFLAFYFLGFLRPFFSFDIHVNYPAIIYPLAIIGMVWFINLFNFMDGIDGIASVEAIYISFVLFFFSHSLIPILLIACVAGFLFWNWPKAEIFLGDAGSTQLGFILIVYGIYFHNSLDFSILNWIMIAAPFWFDATFTLYRRWRNKEKLSQAHRKHAYQRIVQAGFSHRKTLYVLILINTLIFIMILIYRHNGLLKIPLTIVTLCVLYILYKLVEKRVPFVKK